MCEFAKNCDIPTDKRKLLEAFEEMEEAISKKKEKICHIHLLEFARRLIAEVEECLQEDFKGNGIK